MGHCKQLNLFSAQEMEDLTMTHKIWVEVKDTFRKQIRYEIPSLDENLNFINATGRYNFNDKREMKVSFWGTPTPSSRFQPSEATIKMNKEMSKYD